MTIDNTRPIRVLHIASGDLWAGAEVQLFTLAKALINSTNTIVDIILLNHGILEKKLLSDDINVIVLDESKLSSLSILWKLVRIIHQIQPDVIHTHRLKENILGCVAARLNGNIPTLRTMHGAQEHSVSRLQFPKRIIRWLDFFCGRYLQQAIIAVSEDLAAKLKKDFPPNKIYIIENGIDLEEMLNQVVSKNLNNRTNSIKVGFAGRLVPIKRIDMIIRTAHHIQQQNRKLNIVFYIYGEGPLLDELKSLSHTLNTDSVVRFEGYVDNLIEELQKLDILLMTSDHEGLPMVLLEAMAIKTPIISHSVGGIPRLLDYGRCGILVNEHTPSGYAEAIQQLLSTPHSVHEITISAFERVKNDYSADKNANAYKSVYQSLIRHNTY